MDEELLHARILVVEDDRDNLQLMELMFETNGFTNVHSTMDPRRVVDIVAADAPDIMLLDLHMPHIDGLALIEEIAKVIPADPYLPIVLISGDVSREIKERALELGATGFLPKPYEMSGLIELVEESLLERFASRDRTASEADS